MRRDRLTSMFVVLTAAAVATVVAWLMFFRPVREHTTVRTTPGPVFIGSPLTPLRARHTAAGRSPDSTKRSVPPTGPKTTNKPVRSRNRRVPVKKRRTPKRKAARRPARQHPAQPAQPGQNPPPAPQPSKPPVCVTAPAPVTVTAPAVGVNTC